MENKFLNFTKDIEHSEKVTEILEKSKAKVEAQAAAAGIILPSTTTTTVKNG